MKELQTLFSGSSGSVRSSPPGGGAVLLRFTAKWCKPCQNIAPRFQELAASGKFSGTEFLTVDIDRAMDVAAAYGVKSVPTFVLLGAGGKPELRRITGGDMQQLEAALSKHN